MTRHSIVISALRRVPTDFYGEGASRGLFFFQSPLLELNSFQSLNTRSS